MKERPILFSAPMVRAILDGRKTQTRRVVKPQPEANSGFSGGHSIKVAKRFLTGAQVAGEISVEAPYIGTICPYGNTGDQLWVREAFCDATNSEQNRVLYRASGDIACGWKPSIHMPRWASRINLKITGVRAERLQDISEADAIAEGPEPYLLPVHPLLEHLRHVGGYARLWEQINGAGSWAANPWVWVVEFKRVGS